MCSVCNTYPCPCYVNALMYNQNNMYNPNNIYGMHPCPCYIYTPMYNLCYNKQFTNKYIPVTDKIELKDHGPQPFVVNIDEVAKQNNYYRTALWTGNNLQLTLMSLKAGEDIGLEIHPELDQFIRIEDGQGLVKMGDSKDKLDFEEKVYDDSAFIIPAGKWHNLVNTGNKPLKLYSIYAPPQHPHGTTHQTKQF